MQRREETATTLDNLAEDPCRVLPLGWSIFAGNPPRTGRNNASFTQSPLAMPPLLATYWQCEAAAAVLRLALMAALRAADTG